MMSNITFDEFREFHKKRLVEEPKIFKLIEHDRPATKHEIYSVEQEIRTKLPINFATFLMEFGGGLFGLTNIFSADCKSIYYIVDRQKDAKNLIPANAIVFSDDYTGGWYIFRSESGICQEEVYHWNDVDGMKPTAYKNIFNFLTDKAYNT